MNSPSVPINPRLPKNKSAENAITVIRTISLSNPSLALPFFLDEAFFLLPVFLPVFLPELVLLPLPGLLFFLLVDPADIIYLLNFRDSLKSLS
jgi:hypothetical protein